MIGNISQRIREVGSQFTESDTHGRYRSRIDESDFIDTDGYRQKHPYQLLSGGTWGPSGAINFPLGRNASGAASTHAAVRASTVRDVDSGVESPLLTPGSSFDSVERDVTNPVLSETVVGVSLQPVVVAGHEDPSAADVSPEENSRSTRKPWTNMARDQQAGANESNLAHPSK
jgi:hypothetical protein